MNTTYQTMPKDKYAKLVFGCFAILMLYRLHATQYLSFLYNQPLKDPAIDYTFWLSYCLYFPHFIITHFWACLLIDIGVVVFLIACFFSNKNRHIFAILLLIFFFVQRITLDAYTCFHVKSTSCLFIAFLPFCFKDDEKFDLMVEFGRYLLIYILLSAAYHKFTNGGFLSENNFARQLVNQHVDLATLNPTHITYRIAQYLIAHPTIADVLYKMLFFSQAIFIVGIFTKRFDKFLFIFLFAFAVNTYLLMRIYNYDIALLGLCLFYFQRKKIITT